MQIRTYNLWNPAEAPEEPGIIDVPVINEQGKELYVIRLQKPENYEEECYKRFEEKHGFDANIYKDDDPVCRCGRSGTDQELSYYCGRDALGRVVERDTGKPLKSTYSNMNM